MEPTAAGDARHKVEWPCSEATTARAAEQANATAISNEATTARAAEQANATAVSSEETRALAAEATLSADVSDLETQASSLASDGNSASFSGDVSAVNIVASGNLTVQGTTTTVDTVNIDIKDSIMNVSKGASQGTNASNDGGFIVERGSAENNAAFIWDEGDDKFKVLTTSADATSSDISSSDGSAAGATLDVGALEIAGTAVGDYAAFVAGLEGGSSGSGS